MITRYDPKTLDKLWGASEAKATIDGPQMAAKGDRKEIDGEQYESIGIDPRAVKPGDPEAGDPKEHDKMMPGDISDHTGKRFQIWRKIRPTS